MAKRRIIVFLPITDYAARFSSRRFKVQCPTHGWRILGYVRSGFGAPIARCKPPHAPVPNPEFGDKPMTARTTLLVLLMAASLPAFAGGSELDAEINALRNYCKADIERLCPNVQPGGGRIKDCLMANQDQMTVGCAKALKQLKDMKKK
jgi:hypothetical protein